MFNNLMQGLDKILVLRLMLAHISIIAISNYIVQFKFDLFGAQFFERTTIREFSSQCEPF